MLKSEVFPLHKKILNPLVSDYISGKKELEPFYSFYPDRKGFEKALSSASFKIVDRKVLKTELRSQAGKVKNTNKLSLSNIELLASEKTYTVTTGHQLCLFTGPLYFIYKIFSAINLCEKLKQEFPNCDFVPVYWMAGEDHDFEEVNHLNVFGKKIEWKTEQTGSVGNFSTQGLENVLEDLKAIWGAGDQFLPGLFREAYLEHTNLADATRYLVNALFGEFGLVVVDGNSEILKRSFAPFLKKDIFENLPFVEVVKSIANLNVLQYESQVNPREINCFYVEKGLRARIEKINDDFQIHGTDKVFTRSQLEKLIDDEPQKISPNVVLRPCYQQAILPNIAYVGGPGELAYWLEYKAMFEKFGIFFPVLFPRNFVTLIDETTQQKMDKLGLQAEAFFNEEQDLIKEFLEKEHKTVDLEPFKSELKTTFDKLGDEVARVDATLRSTAEAELHKSLNSINHIEQKLNRAIKQRSDTEINQIKTVRSKLFPGSVPQERVDNFSMYYLKWGNEFLTSLKSLINYDLKNFKTIILKSEA